MRNKVNSRFFTTLFKSQEFCKWHFSEEKIVNIIFWGEGYGSGPLQEISPEAGPSPAFHTIGVQGYFGSVQPPLSEIPGSAPDILLRLGGVRYKAAIDNLENECMDPDTEDHFKQLLSEWKKDEDNIKDELKEIGTKITDVMKKLDDLTAATVPNRQESINESRC